MNIFKNKYIIGLSLASIFTPMAVNFGTSTNTIVKNSTSISSQGNQQAGPGALANMLILLTTLSRVFYSISASYDDVNSIEAACTESMNFLKLEATSPDHKNDLNNFINLQWLPFWNKRSYSLIVNPITEKDPLYNDFVFVHGNSGDFIDPNNLNNYKLTINSNGNDANDMSAIFNAYPMPIIKEGVTIQTLITDFLCFLSTEYFNLLPLGPVKFLMLAYHFFPTDENSIEGLTVLNNMATLISHAPVLLKNFGPIITWLVTKNPPQVTGSMLQAMIDNSVLAKPEYNNSDHKTNNLAIKYADFNAEYQRTDVITKVLVGMLVFFLEADNPICRNEHNNIFYYLFINESIMNIEPMGMPTASNVEWMKEAFYTNKYQQNPYHILTAVFSNIVDHQSINEPFDFLSVVARANHIHVEISKGLQAIDIKYANILATDLNNKPAINSYSVLVTHLSQYLTDAVEYYKNQLIQIQTDYLPKVDSAKRNGLKKALMNLSDIITTPIGAVYGLKALNIYNVITFYDTTILTLLNALK